MNTETTSGEPPRDAASEHAAAEAMERLRSAPAAEIMAELFSTLLSTAHVKLGRRDARLFIDLCGQMLEYAEPHLPEALAKQVQGALGQLRLAQVNAENDAGREAEPNDLSRTPTPPRSTGQAKPEDTGPHATPSPASKLWVPGS